MGIFSGLFGGDAVVPEGSPVVVEVDGAEAEDRLGAGDAPTHAGAFHAIFDQVLAGALDHAAADGVTGG